MSRELRPIAVHVTGPPPVSDIYIDLEPGVTAYYGLNGAGKTRLIDAIAALLDGNAHYGGTVIAHADIAELSGVVDTHLAGALWQLVFDYEYLGYSHDAEMESLDPDVAIPLEDVFAEIMAPIDASDPDTRRWARAVAEQGIWILEPVPARQNSWSITPTWDARLFEPDLAAELNRIVERLSDALAAEPISWNRVDEVVNHPLIKWSDLGIAVENRDLGEATAQFKAFQNAPRRPYAVIGAGWQPVAFEEVWSPLAHVVTGSRSNPGSLSVSTATAVRELRSLSDWVQEHLANGGLDGEDVDRSALAAELVSRASSSATDIVRSALRQQITFSCERATPEAGELDAEWFWSAAEPNTPELAIAELSAAQARWSCLAIEVALRTELRRMEMDLEARRLGSDILSEVEHLKQELESFDPMVTPEEQAAEAREWNLAIGREGYGESAPGEDDEVILYDSQGGSGGYEPDFDEIAYSSYESQSEDPEDYFEYEDPYAMRDRKDLQDAIDARYAELEAFTSGYFTDYPLPRMVTIVDEPEAGLHRSAEYGAVDELVRLAKVADISVIVGTHSPEFLGVPSVTTKFVRRTGSRRTSVLISGRRAAEMTLEELGLNPHDRLGMYRAFLLVEGRHDELVLERLVGSELRDLRVHVIPLHGGKEISHAADARLLVDFTDQPVVCLVDKVHQGPVDELFNRLRTLSPSQVDEIDKVVRDVRESLPQKWPEFDWVVRLARRAHELGTLDRFSIRGLPADDILHLLPPGPVVPGGKSWDDLTAEHSKAATQAGKSVGPLKPWLTKKYRADFSDAAIEAACTQLDEIPKEFTDLLDVLAELGS